MKPRHLIFFCFLCVLMLPPAGAHGAETAIYILDVSGTINPGVSEYLENGIQRANLAGGACVIIRLDTPGGLADSMRDIVMAMLGSKIPVVVFVAPSGARAASAGVMITMAADIAAMAPGTNIGAAHPVGVGGKEIDDVMTDKVVNDMVAHARSVAEKRGRNADWVEQAVRESVSITETEALEKNVIDLIARDTDDLIRQIEGRTVAEKGTLKLGDAERVVLEETLRNKILKTISDPNIAYILLMIGLAGLYFELSNPGAIFPGVIGGICLILAFFSLQTLPVNYAGILLILLALVLFFMEIKITSYGLLSIAGVSSLLLGSLMLFESSFPEMKLSWQVFLPTISLVSLFFVTVASLAYKAQVSKPRTGEAGLIGEVGVVRKDLSPTGKIFIHGELWHAAAKIEIPVGEKVRVIGIENLVLQVEPVQEPPSQP